MPVCVVRAVKCLESHLWVETLPPEAPDHYVFIGKAYVGPQPWSSFSFIDLVIGMDTPANAGRLLSWLPSWLLVWFLNSPQILIRKSLHAKHRAVSIDFYLLPIFIVGATGYLLELTIQQSF